MTSTHRKTCSISIIIPTLNEEENIEALANQFRNCDCDIIIVDGGSSDNTVKLAELSNFQVFENTNGRAAQLNTGASKARGDVLLFLHADTQLPKNFASEILDAIKLKDFILGAFKLSIKNATYGMKFIASCANLRSKLFNLPYGDQALFMKKEVFFALEQFPDLPIMEDYVLVKKARTKGRIYLSNNEVITSARRWERLGVTRTTIINQLIIAGFYLNISPQKLMLLYRR